jgi:hypothetical protein
MNEDDRAVLDYLNAADEDPDLERWVLMITTDQQDFLAADSKQGARPDDLDCDRADVYSLAEHGYIQRQGNRFRISEKGKRLIARGFQEVPEQDTGRSVQNINISGGTVGNLSTSLSGDAIISRSPVNQGSAGAHDLGELLQRLIDSIDESEELAMDVKGDAKLEANQVALELQKNRIDLPEIERHLTKLGALVGGAATVVTNLDKLGDAIRALGIG